MSAIATLASAEAATSNFPVLTALVLVPAVGALIIATMSKRRPEWVKLTAGDVVRHRIVQDIVTAYENAPKR